MLTNKKQNIFINQGVINLFILFPYKVAAEFHYQSLIFHSLSDICQKMA